MEAAHPQADLVRMHSVSKTYPNGKTNFTRRRIVLPNGLTALLISDPEMADAVAADGVAADAEEGADSGSEEGSDEVSTLHGQARCGTYSCGGMRKADKCWPSCMRPPYMMCTLSLVHPDTC